MLYDNHKLYKANGYSNPDYMIRKINYNGKTIEAVCKVTEVRINGRQYLDIRFRDYKELKPIEYSYSLRRLSQYVCKGKQKVDGAFSAYINIYFSNIHEGTNKYDELKSMKKETVKTMGYTFFEGINETYVPMKNKIFK